MIRSTADVLAEELPEPICEFCGCPIEDQEQECVALEDGVCQP